MANLQHVSKIDNSNHTRRTVPHPSIWTLFCCQSAQDIVRYLPGPPPHRRPGSDIGRPSRPVGTRTRTVLALDGMIYISALVKLHGDFTSAAGSNRQGIPQAAPFERTSFLRPMKISLQLHPLRIKMRFPRRKM